MYEIEFGLTYLRTFVYIILTTEIIAFIPIIVYIFNKRFDFIKWCFIIGICAYCVANYMNIEKLIISKNISRNDVHPIDYEYIYKIVSQDSYEILEERLSKEAVTSEEKLDILNILLNITSNTKGLNWQEFNISKYKMKKIDRDTLLKQKDEINKEILKQENDRSAISGSSYSNIL